MAKKQIIKGTKQEQEAFTECIQHYEMAKEDLASRKSDWDTKDELFRSYLNESDWPYNALVFDPRIFTAIFEKTSRMFARKPRGRLVPREGGDAIGAKINNEMLKFQWDEAERVDGMPMLAKWAMMDMNARKYGASFALCKWRYERRTDGKNKKSVPWFDGPTFRPLLNRDSLPNPSYSSIKNWFQHRDYVTLQELENVNDAARGKKPIYKNLDILRDVLREEAKVADTRASNWTSRNLSIKGLTDYLGRDETFKTVEVITEYRNNRWISFCPKHGVVIRDIDNPYDHGRIPIVMLRYYPIDDDLYGLSELEPVESDQKAINAILCQYLDAINQSLYQVLKVRTTGVQMHTLEFGPGKKWLMNDPATDVLPLQMGATGIAEFNNTYSTLVASMMNALGESSLGVSNIPQGEMQSEKTATEVRQLMKRTNARDNFNQIFLSQAIKKQMMFWLLMNRQFIFSDPDQHYKVFRIVGKDAIEYFKRFGLGAKGLTPESIEQLTSPEMIDVDVNVRQFMQPLFPVETEEGVMPKFRMQQGGEMGTLLLEPEDFSGNYDYIPDIESMTVPDESRILGIQRNMIEMAKDPATTELLAAQGYKLNLKDLMQDFFERLGKQDAGKYFEKLKGGKGGQIPPEQRGAPGARSRRTTGPTGQQPGMAGGSKAMAGRQTAKQLA